jgi:hypothetical protein
MNRTAREVAARAIVLGALGVRASFEVTKHPRSRELCSQLLPWLEQVGLGPQIEEFHREILETPHGDLPRDSETEAVWRGEAAALFGWAIELFDKPDVVNSIDPGLLLRNLSILRPTATEILSSARLRSRDEIDDYCAYCMAVRHQHQLASLEGDGQAVLSSIHQARVTELGVNEAYRRLNGVELEASTLASTVPHLRGLYVVRAMAAEWLLGADE